MLRFALVFLKYWLDLAYAKGFCWIASAPLKSSNSAGILSIWGYIQMKQRSCQEMKKWQWCKARRQSRVLTAQEAGQGAVALQGRVLWHCRDFPVPSPPAAASPECPEAEPWGQHSATIGDSTVPPRCAERSRELWHCLTEHPASSCYTCFPRKLNEMKRRSIAFCFEVFNLAFPVSPAGTKLIQYRHSALFSWYPTAVTVLLPELLTHAACSRNPISNEIFRGKIYSFAEEQHRALGCTCTGQPSTPVLRMSPHGLGWVVAQSTGRGIQGLQAHSKESLDTPEGNWSVRN